MSSETPLNEPVRLRTLREAVLLDTPAEQAFDRLAELATRVLHAPVALVSLVDEDRQFFKSCIGLPDPWATARETPLTHSFCQHAVNTGEPLVIQDAREHPLVHDNLAIVDLDVIAYAGIPLELDGHVIGSFCVIDSQPRQWTERELEILQTLAESVMTEIQLRVTQRELERAAEEREEVLRMVSHDLRNPLSLVLSAARLLDTEGLADDQRARQRDIIRRAAGRMLRLTQDLLDLRALESSALELDRSPVPVAELLAEAAEVARAQEPGIDIVVEAAPDDGGGGSGEVRVDADRIQQALGNLISNALRVTPAGGTLRLGSVHRGDTVHIHVEDQGPGIPEDELERVFDRFFQGNGDTRGKAGVGLTIVRAVVRAHGGTVRAENLEGGGARFTLELPVG